MEKTLCERCKHFGLQFKSSATVELPSGWEPGPQEGTIEWDEDWDKFDDEDDFSSRSISPWPPYHSVPSFAYNMAASTRPWKRQQLSLFAAITAQKLPKHHGDRRPVARGRARHHRAYLG